MKEADSTSRRGFLRGAGAAGAAAAAAVAAAAPRAGASTPVAPPAGAEAARAEGYRVSEHVRRYYRTTTI